MKCIYGCGKEALFSLEIKPRCSKSHTQCPEIGKKITNKLKLAHKNGKFDYIPSNLKNWRKNPDSKGYKKWVERIDNDILIKGSDCRPDRLRWIMIHFLHIEYICTECKILEWREKELTLHIDHIDGDNTNNLRGNLQFLCPNCHSLTDTYCGKNINTGKIKVSDDELLNALLETKNIRQALIKCNLTPKGGNYQRVYKLMKGE